MQGLIEQKKPVKFKFSKPCVVCGKMFLPTGKFNKVCTVCYKTGKHWSKK